MYRWLVDNAHVILWTVGCVCGFVAAIGVLQVRGAREWRTVVALVWALFGLMLGGVWQARLEWMPIGEALLISPADVLSGGGRITLGLAQLLLGPFKTQPGKGKPQHFIGLLKDSSGRSEVLIQVAPHPRPLRTLTGEYISDVA